MVSSLPTVVSNVALDTWTTGSPALSSGNNETSRKSAGRSFWNMLENRRNLSTILRCFLPTEHANRRTAASIGARRSTQTELLLETWTRQGNLGHLLCPKFSNATRSFFGQNFLIYY